MPGANDGFGQRIPEAGQLEKGPQFRYASERDNIVAL